MRMGYADVFYTYFYITVMDVLLVFINYLKNIYLQLTKLSSLNDSNLGVL